MLLARWNPFVELAAVERNLDRLFTEAFGTDSAETKPSQPAHYRLPVNVTEEKGQYRLSAPVPGFKPEEVEVTCNEGVLTIIARHSEEAPPGGYLCREVRYGNLYRQIPLGNWVDPAQIRASFENGMLNVFIPVPTKPEPVSIPISPSPDQQVLEGSAQGAGSSTD